MPRFSALKLRVVEAVEQEVNQIRHDSFSTLGFQQIYQMVVGSRQEFYQDLAYNADSRFLLIRNRQVIEVMDDIAAELLELSDEYGCFGRDEVLCRLLPIFHAWHCAEPLTFS